jgi:hypothetical protein
VNAGATSAATAAWATDDEAGGIASVLAHSHPAIRDGLHLDISIAEREDANMRNLGLLAISATAFALLAGCGNGGNAAAPVTHKAVTWATVCKAFNAETSPIAHSSRVANDLASLAAQSQDEGVRQAGVELLRDGASAKSSLPLGEIGAACVSQGLTPKDWLELN